ncbi:unnamed protein product [Phytophthora lilii]|uniref:Unnamed protein product n=1 Tax=Phytophthora lilii TaxID=2077276 RepID=A0A9W6U0H8_9STRA|nr:unnamed protein product [Phytophthora lilii]
MDNNRQILLEMLQITHPHLPIPHGVNELIAVSRVELNQILLTESRFLNVALFAYSGGVTQPLGLAAYRAGEGTSLFFMSSEISDSRAKDDDSDDDEMDFDGDLVALAKYLADVPVFSLSKKRVLESYKLKLDKCTESIGRDEDDSRIIFERLLTIAGGIREYASSSSTPTFLPMSMLKWCAEISELSYKWTTFQLLQTSSRARAGASEISPQDAWLEFQRKPTLETLLSYAKMGSMRAVIMLWSRHLNDEIVQNIAKLLQSLPISLPVSAFADWIQNDVVPTLIQLTNQAHPTALDTENKSNSQNLLGDVTLWLLKRSEAAASKGDVDSAIQICNLLKGKGSRVADISIPFYEFKLQSSTSSSNHEANSGPFERIEVLGKHLEHVKHLAVEHNFIISLSVFEGETPATIAMSMLDRVAAPDLLKQEVKDHVRKYLRFCDVDPDSVIRDYVTELAESIQSSQSAEESRALALLDEIFNSAIREDATLTLLRSLLPPYSQEVKQFVNNCARSWRSERLEEIEEHVRLMNIQDMLMTYGVKHFDLADAKSASRLVACILNQISRPTAVVDALCLVDAYNDLHCDRVVVQFTENLLSDCSGFATADNPIDEIKTRTTKAMSALAEVKKRMELKAHVMLFVSLLEEITEFGITLIELEAADSEDALDKTLGSLAGCKPRSYVLCLLEALVAAYLPELSVLQEIAAANRNVSVISYIESSAYLLSENLLTDLQRMRRIEADYGILFSLSELRDPEECEMKLKQLIIPEIMFEDDEDNSSNVIPAAPDAVSFRKGKGKKRAVPSGRTSVEIASKRRKVGHDESNRAYAPQLQNDARSRLTFDLNRLAAAVGISSKTYQSLLAQRAAQCGSILHAARFSREIFSRRSIDHSGVSLTTLSQSSSTDRFNAAEALKQVAISLSLFTAAHVREVYDTPRVRTQQITPAQSARIQAPLHTLELLKYALCICEKESFDETLVLLKNTLLVKEVLGITQFDLSTSRDGEVLGIIYPRWYREDACVLPSYQAMKFATRFAIAEHKNLRREPEDRDAIASKRYISFLVDQQADLLSVQALLSMQGLPNDAVTVVHTQLGKLLSTVFQSQDIDNYLALGLMLSIEQEAAFHAFRRQISRENIAKDYKRFQQLAFIGADAARAWQQIAFLHQCVELDGNARWWHYLTLLGMECDHKAFQSERRDLEYIRRLVPTLITRSNYDFYTVLEFTRHYQIDDNFPSLAYAESLLLRESKAANLDYQNKIAGVIEDIHEQHLVKLLLKSIPKISGQDYDRLLFVFRLLLDNTSYSEKSEVQRRVDILHILNAFAALQDTGTLGTESQELDATESSITVSKEVISFHELVEKPLAVLGRVLTKENLSTLIGLAEPLQLEPDELQMILLKNMVDLNIQKNKAGFHDKASSQTPFSEFESILKCLSDSENRVTASEWLADKFPLGEEKLKALEFALHSAVTDQGGTEDSTNNTSFSGNEALARLEAKTLRVKVELLLQNASSQTSSLVEVVNEKNEMGELLALVSEPKKLFLELYRRYTLRFYITSNDMLHTVADSIADLLQLPFVKLRLELVREWLVKEAVYVRSGSADNHERESPFEPLEAENLHKTDEDYVKRVLYVVGPSMKCGDSTGEQLLGYLIDFAKDTRPRAGVTFRAKMRALHIILRIGQLYERATRHYLMAKYKTTSSDTFFNELLEYAKTCRHMIMLEEHHVPYDIAFVLKSDKEVLVRSLLRRYSLNQPWLLQTVSQIMLDFGVDTIDLWEAVLSNMDQLGMIRSLANILGPLSRKSFVRSLRCGRQLWEEVMALPMIELKRKYHEGQCDQKKNPSDERGGSTLCFAGVPVSGIRYTLERMVMLLQRCPFLDQIDVPAFVIHLRDLTEMAEETINAESIATELNLHGFAVKCAMIIPKPVSRFETLVRIIRAGAYGSVLQELLDTSCFLEGEHNDGIVEDDTGELADNFRLVQESFAEAAKRKDYAAILGTPFEKGFVEYLAATSDIDYLLSLLLEDKRMETALDVIEFYYEYHPTAMPSLVDEEARNEQSSEDTYRNRWKLIDAYIKSTNSACLERFKAA